MPITRPTAVAWNASLSPDTNPALDTRAREVQLHRTISTGLRCALSVVLSDDGQRASLGFVVQSEDEIARVDTFLRSVEGLTGVVFDEDVFAANSDRHHSRVTTPPTAKSPQNA